VLASFFNSLLIKKTGQGGFQQGQGGQQIKATPGTDDCKFFSTKVSHIILISYFLWTLVKTVRSDAAAELDRLTRNSSQKKAGLDSLNNSSSEC
jgi:hypothetical protein